MSDLDAASTDSTLNSLRKTRQKLFAIPDAELNALSSDDQVKYGSSLHQVSLAILKLETAKLQGVNAAFAAEQGKLNLAAANLEKDTAALTDAVQVIRAVSEGLAVVSKIVSLLG
jgi:hypothetical protein